MVLYAPPHGKLELDAHLYRKAVSVAPCVIGTKTDAQDQPAFRKLVRAVPGHSHFSHECYLVASARMGGQGSYSALAGIGLQYMKDWWAMIERKDWKAAEQRQYAVNAFYAEAVVPLREGGYIAGAIDKSMAQIGGAKGTRLVRPPYPSAPERLYRNLLRAARKHLPEAFED